MPAFSTVERAFQIARSGECASLEDLRATLSREGYTDAMAQTSSPLLRNQLQDLMHGLPPRTARTPNARRKRGVLSITSST